ncbi:MAG: exopolysaccharide Pel transporter PelG, partial [Clostridiales bacterium]
FYSGFKIYLYKIENGETLEEIKETKKEVSNIFKQKMQTLMEIQIIFSLAALITGQLVLPRLGVSSMVTDMFSTLVPGYYFYICMYVVILILLYFDDQTGALLVTVSFFVTSMLFTLITIKMGKEFYGTGFCLSSFFSLVLAFVRLKRYFENLEYHIFSSGDIEN